MRRATSSASSGPASHARALTREALSQRSDVGEPGADVRLRLGERRHAFVFLHVAGAGVGVGAGVCVCVCAGWRRRRLRFLAFVFLGLTGACGGRTDQGEMPPVGPVGASVPGLVPPEALEGAEAPPEGGATPPVAAE